MRNEPSKTILILGGTSEAAALAGRLANNTDQRIITSLAGRTKTPLQIAGELRIGGFGGVEGMVAYLTSNKIDHVIDATHPFATQISANAEKACKLAGVSLEQMTRPPWKRQQQDNWQPVASLEEAARVLPQHSRVFLALGSQHIETFAARRDIHFVVRMVDAPIIPLAFEDCVVISGRPGNSASEEKALFSAHQITHLVCRNSGGKRGYAKVEAARILKLDVVMIER